MRVLIVDSEVQSRRALRRLCREAEDIEVVGEVDCGMAAIAAAQVELPDLVILEAELPEMSGFETLRSMGSPTGPLAIVVSSHPEHASQAFDAQAVDFLSKPLHSRRFFLALDRARHQLGNRHVGDNESNRQDLGARPALEAGVPRALLGEKERRLYVLELGKIDYIESARNYVWIHVGDELYISRDTLKHLSTVLAPAGFVRIERSRLLNLRAVSFVERQEYGTLSFALRHGPRLESTATYRTQIVRALRGATLGVV